MAMCKQTAAGRVTVPVPDHREVRTGTLIEIIERSGLPRSLFEV
jgi:hypothetical protein